MQVFENIGSRCWPTVATIRDQCYIYIQTSTSSQARLRLRGLLAFWTSEPVRQLHFFLPTRAGSHGERRRGQGKTSASGSFTPDVGPCPGTVPPRPQMPRSGCVISATAALASRCPWAADLAWLPAGAQVRRCHQCAKRECASF